METIGLKAIFEDSAFQAGVRRYEATLKRISVETKTTATELSRASKGAEEFGDTLKGTEGAVSGLGNAMQVLKLGIAGLSLYTLANQFAEFASRASELGSQFEALSLTGDRLARSLGETAETMIEGVVRASDGMIDRLSAISAVNKALAFGIVNSRQEMEELTRIAVALGTAMGMNATQALEDFTVALGRNSPRILDNLGLIVKETEAYEMYARALGKSADALTEEEKKRAFQQAALQKGRELVEQLGDVSQTHSASVQRLNAEWKNFTVEFGETINLLLDATGVFEQAREEIERWRASLVGWRYVVGEAIPALQEYNKQAQESAEIQRDMIVQTLLAQKAWDALAEAFGHMPLDQIENALVRSIASWEDYDLAVRQIIQRLPQLEGVLGMTREEFEKQREALMNAARAFEGLRYDPTVEISRNWDAAREAVEDLTQAIQDNTDALGRSITTTIWGKEIWARYADEVRNAGDAQQQMIQTLQAYSQAVGELFTDFQTGLLGGMANYILNYQDMLRKAEDATRDHYMRISDISADAARQREDNEKSLQERLAEIEQERQEKIAWVRTGAHARTPQQEAEAEAWWNAQYDQMIADTIAKYEERNRQIDQKEEELKAAAARRYAEQKAEQERALEEMKLRAVLGFMETTGQIYQFTGGWATNATQAMQLIQSGILPVTDQMAQQIQTVYQAMAGNMQTTTDQMAENQKRLSDALKGQYQSTVDSEEAQKGLQTQLQASGQAASDMSNTAQTSGQVVASALDLMIQRAKDLEKGYQEAASEYAKALDDIAKKGETFGKDVVDGLIKGIKSKGEEANKAMKDLVNNMLKAAREAAGAQSPSMEAYYLGMDTAQGLVIGLNSRQELLTQTSQDMVARVIEGWAKGARLTGHARNFLADHLRRFLATQIKFVPGTTLADAVGKTLQVLMEEALDDLGPREGPRLVKTIQRSMADILAGLGATANIVLEVQTEALKEQMDKLQRIAGALGSLGTSALQLQRQEGEQRIRQLKQQLSLVIAEHGTLEEQQNILAQIAEERAKLVELERIQTDLQRQQSQMQFLQQQIQLIQMLREFRLDPRQILQGLQLGLHVDYLAFAQAMQRAMEGVIQRLNEMIPGYQHGGVFTVPPGYPHDTYRIGLTSGERVIVIPAGRQTREAPVMNLTVGPINVANDMDVAVLRALIVQTVHSALRS